MVTEEDNIYKILLLGEGGVGKTSLTKQFVYQRFDEKYLKTLGTNISKKDVLLGSELGNAKVHLQIWDVLGQKAFRTIIKSAFNGARGVLFVCDLTNKSTLEKLDIWVNYAYQYSPRTSFVFLANKSDLSGHQFGGEELAEYAGRFNSPSFLTSARTGDYVEEVFAYLAKAIYTKQFAPPREEVRLEEPVDEGAVAPRIRAEDRIINTFCQEAGGFQVSMPIVRQHFQKHGIDFETATKDELLKIVESLTKYLVFIKGEGVAKEYYRKMRKIIIEME